MLSYKDKGTQQSECSPLLFIAALGVSRRQPLTDVSYDATSPLVLKRVNPPDVSYLFRYSLVLRDTNCICSKKRTRKRLLSLRCDAELSGRVAQNDTTAVALPMPPESLCINSYSAAMRLRPSCWLQQHSRLGEKNCRSA